MNRYQKVIRILNQELGAVGDKAERTASLILNAVEYKKRSVAQNNYFWGCIIEPLARHFGDDPYSFYIDMCHKFNTVARPGKPNHTRHVSEKDWMTRDQEEMNEKIRTWAAQEYQFIIPLPKEVV